jgi:hypothetical protein
MAKQGTQTRSRSSSNGSGSRRRSSAKPHAKTSRNQGQKQTVPEQEYEDYTLLHPGSISDTDEPDVLLDIPVVNVDKIHFELDDLHARVSLHAEVLDLVKLSVGVHAELGKVDLDIEGVEAQALLRMRLDHVTAIIDRVLTTLDRNPQLVEHVGRTVEKLGSSAASAVKNVGQGAEGAVEDVGQGAGGAVKDVGQGAGQAVGEVGQGAGQAVGGLGQGAGQALGGLGQGGNGDGGGTGGGGGGATAPALAKQVLTGIAHEIGSAASDEARDLGMAATYKVKELGERRRQRRAEKRDATEGALRRAEALGVNLNDVEGTGAGGRITVRDVVSAGGGND